MAATSNMSNGCLEPVQREDPPSLLPKHKIFLSHSSAQKPFVEQLCVELEKSGYSPFFDRRPDSLPKGEKFPELILKAAKQCLVAVVVLSREFLTSKWPMLELVAFTEAQRSSNLNLRILPLFYKLQVSDLKDKQLQIDIVESARSLAAHDTRIDPNEWEQARRVLACTNGEEYKNYGESEVAYRSAIVASICRLCKPDVQFDLSAMQGKDRMCKILAEAFEKQKRHDDACPAALGLYGMGGTGKSQLCMAMCNHFHAEYAGKVCYIQYKNDGDVMNLQKEILKSLTNASKMFLHSIDTIEQGNGALKDMLPQVDVFLALDNVHDGDGCLLKVVSFILKYLSSKSKALVTSRSSEVLKGVFTNGIIMHVPPLKEVEAMAIFRQYAVPSRALSSFTVREVCILESCIDKCYFLHDMVEERYHPFALEVLGSYFAGVDANEPTKWAEKCSLPTQSETFYKDPVFRILKTGYDALRTQRHKFLFLDVALFVPRSKFRRLDDLHSWLQGVHDLSPAEVTWQIENLKRKALVQEAKDSNGCGCIIVHDLYKELCLYEIKREATQRWCVYEKRQTNSPESNLTDQTQQELVRVKLQVPHLSMLRKRTLQEWSNVQVLSLQCEGLENLDIRPLKRLRSLEVFSKNLKALSGTDNMEHLRFVQLRCPSLKDLNFSNNDRLEALSMDSFYSARSFGFDIRAWWPWFIPRRMVNLANSSVIQKIEILNHGFPKQTWGERWEFSLAGFESLSNLRDLQMRHVPVKSLQGLEELKFLEDLAVYGCDQHTVVIPDLSRCINLKRLNVSFSNIREILGLQMMRSLEWLYCEECEVFEGFKGLLDLRSLENLKVIFTTLDSQSVLAPEGVLRTTYAKLRNYLVPLVKKANPHLSIAFLRSTVSVGELLKAAPIGSLQRFSSEASDELDKEHICFSCHHVREP